MRGLAALAAVAALSPGTAWADAWNFRVLLDGRDIGRHVFSVQGNDGVQRVTSEARFDVRLLRIPVWRYDHHAVEQWDGGCLHALDSWTVTNGERVSVVARAEGEKLLVTRTTGSDELRGCIMSFAYWDPRILRATQLLNSQTGELMPVEVRSEGVESLDVRGRPLAAERHRITSAGLRIDVWYADGRWVALEALAPGGRVLRYQLDDGRAS